MLRAGAGTLVTPALGSVVSRWASAPQHVVHPSLVTETKARPLLFFFFCQVTTGSGAWQWVPAQFPPFCGNC